MNKLDRIKNLENELAELKAEIIEEEKTKDWNPSGGNLLVCSTGEVSEISWGSDRYRNFGVEFDNKNQAQQAAIAYRRYHRLYRLALELNGDWVPDFLNQEEDKYYIFNSYNTLKVNICNVAKRYCDIYFKTEKLAQKAIDILGDELV